MKTMVMGVGNLSKEKGEDFLNTKVGFERRERKSNPRGLEGGKEVSKQGLACFGVVSREPLLVSWPFPCMVCISFKVVITL